MDRKLNFDNNLSDIISDKDLADKENTFPRGEV